MASSSSIAQAPQDIRCCKRRRMLWMNIRCIVDGRNDDYPEGTAPLDTEAIAHWKVINRLQAENQLILDTIVGRLSLAIQAIITLPQFIYQLNWGYASESGMVDALPHPAVQDIHRFFCCCQPPQKDWSPAVVEIARISEDLVSQAAHSPLHLNHWWDNNNLLDLVSGVATCLNVQLHKIREITAAIDKHSQVITALPILSDPSRLPFNGAILGSTVDELDGNLSPLPSHLFEAMESYMPELAYPKCSDGHTLQLMRRNYLDQYNAVLEAKRVFWEKLFVLSLASSVYDKVMYKTYPDAED
ncbi:hypothetical protein JAAARDRAFT_188463 [Jaapia argillacea MUCL 33604]|uniref:Uncharacterized protein n=1 Tax=Jaapia argillacea MUCL 33604 TaxID=933084 RepID=A0A067QG89_9AGAM|nr:hypothetical protein JAAARDRAFT_188463 [Jaapia argillacea MUCL 33604]